MPLTDLFLGYALNFGVALIIVRGIYYPAKQDKDYVFTFLAFSTVIYFVVAFLTSIEISVGVGFGLFAIFSVLRYRTSTMSTRAMTYLFIVIALPIMNSILIRLNGWAALLSVNAVIVIVLYILEKGWGFHYEASKAIRYDRIELIVPEKHNQLMEDLRLRTGLPIKRFTIGRLNFLDDSAEVRVYYDEVAQSVWSGDEDTTNGLSQTDTDDD